MEGFYVAVLQRSIRGEVPREAGTPLRHQKTREPAQGRVNGVVRHEAGGGGKPQARKGEGE